MMSSTPAQMKSPPAELKSPPIENFLTTVLVIEQSYWLYQKRTQYCNWQCTKL